ncbi:MAG: inorganic pyrophosphatase [Pseudomonadota bacterium]
MTDPIDLWDAYDRLLDRCPLTIDRPKGTAHPHLQGIAYPLDYGFLQRTTSADGDGIDVWRGSNADPHLVALVVTVDLMKRDSEVKLLLGCTVDEVASIVAFHNASDTLRAQVIWRSEERLDRVAL